MREPLFDSEVTSEVTALKFFNKLKPFLGVAKHIENPHGWIVALGEAQLEMRWMPNLRTDWRRPKFHEFVKAYALPLEAEHSG